MIEWGETLLRDLNFDMRIERALYYFGAVTVKDILDISADQLLGYPHFGKRSLAKLRERLLYYNLALKGEKIEFDQYMNKKIEKI